MRTKIVGLTGGIGSGKTTIARYFKTLGVPVYIADEEAKKILFMPDAVTAVKEVFGDGVFTGSLPDRQKLAAVVFNNPEMLQKLNGIIHPRVKEHFSQWVANHTDAPFVIKEAAILFESGSYKDCDKIILVTAPADVRIKRVMQRDNVTEDEVKRRMANQWEEAEKKKLADYIIENIDLESAEADAYSIYKELKIKKK